MLILSIYIGKKENAGTAVNNVPCNGNNTQRDRLTRLDLPRSYMVGQAQLRIYDAELKKFYSPFYFYLAFEFLSNPL